MVAEELHRNVRIIRAASPWGNAHARAISVPVPNMSGLDDRSKVVKFYRSQEAQRRKPLPDLSPFSLTNICQGLGDTVVISDLPRTAALQGSRARVYSTSRHFDPLMRFNPFFSHGHGPFLVSSPTLLAEFNCGNGHTVQRLQRAFGYPATLLPKGCIEVPGARRDMGRVVMHWEAGDHAAWQARYVHPRPRQLYPENRLILEEFIRQRPDLEFIEIGSNPLGIRGASVAEDFSLEDTIKLMAGSGWFIGIISGPMHVAAALGLRVVNVINFPHPELIYLPTCVDTGQVESEWFYPQNVHLHQEGGGGQVKQFSLRNLHRAMAGEIYPYWSQDYLDLIEEFA